MAKAFDDNRAFCEIYTKVFLNNTNEFRLIMPRETPTRSRLDTSDSQLHQWTKEVLTSKSRKEFRADLQRFLLRQKVVDLKKNRLITRLETPSSCCSLCSDIFGYLEGEATRVNNSIEKDYLVDGAADVLLLFEAQRDPCNNKEEHSVPRRISIYWAHPLQIRLQKSGCFISGRHSWKWEELPLLEIRLTARFGNTDNLTIIWFTYSQTLR